MDNKKQTAEQIKRMIIESCNYVSENDIRITTDIAKYHGTRNPDGSVNRNAGTGELATWILIEVPEIPEAKSDSYYQRNPHRRKVTEDEVERTKSRVEMIAAVCEKAAQIHGAEYIGYNTASEGFDSTTGNTRYLNIRLQ